MLTSWCDKLSSVPALGVSLNPSYTPTAVLLSSLEPLLNRLGNIDIQQQGPFAANVTTEDGFIYAFDHVKFWVEFKYRLKVQPTSGGPPVANLTTSPRKYTDLLLELQERIIEAADSAYSKERIIGRVGVISTTTVLDTDFPPGFAKYRDYFTKPWDSGVFGYNIGISANLTDDKDWTDRCIHNFSKDDGDNSGIATLRLDWQRLYKSNRRQLGIHLKRELDFAIEGSLAYFEELAEGHRFE